MTGKGWRLTRRGKRLLWLIGAALLLWLLWLLNDGYEACMAAGHAWEDCAAL